MFLFELRLFSGFLSIALRWVFTAYISHYLQLCDASCALCSAISVVLAFSSWFFLKFKDSQCIWNCPSTDDFLSFWIRALCFDGLRACVRAAWCVVAFLRWRCVWIDGEIGSLSEWVSELSLGWSWWCCLLVAGDEWRMNGGWKGGRGREGEGKLYDLTGIKKKKKKFHPSTTQIWMYEFFLGRTIWAWWFCVLGGRGEVYVTDVGSTGLLIVSRRPVLFDSR